MAGYPQIAIGEWTQVGEGYNGQAYVSAAHPGVMLKLVRRELGAAHKVEQEFQAAKTAYEIGLPTPQVYEIVRDGEDHGYLCQMLAFWDAFARAYTGRDDIEALNRELRPYAVLDLVRTFHLHAQDKPDLVAFLKSWINRALEAA